MGLPDTYDVLWQCDRWLLLGAPRVIPNQLYRAIEEQGWEAEQFLPELLDRWHHWTQMQVGYAESAAYHRGYGWRVWMMNAAEPVDSLHVLWSDLLNGIIGAVVYLGGARRIVQGKDPFFLQGGVPCSCKHANELQTLRPPDVVQPKYGVWVTDEEMAAFRKQAIFSFGVEG